MPSMTINLTIHDFGNVKEDEGVVTHNFVFLNSGTAPLKIADVTASCGCTIPEWTTDSIPPGQLGYIKVAYDPTNRPGTFNKTLTVTSNADSSVTVLHIEGTVLKSPIEPEADYPVLMGNLRVKSKIFNMGNITTKEPQVSRFQIYNDSQDTIRFLGEMETPRHIRVLIEPRQLLPGETATISILYNTKISNNLGFITDNITLTTNDEESAKKSFHVNAVIEEYFPPMALEELAKAPSLTFEQVVQDFGQVSQGSLPTASILFTNTGYNDLNIRSLQPNCTCITATLDKDTLKPGESGFINIVFDTQGRIGYEQRAVAVFSNDPRAPTQVITVKGTVKE